MQGKVLISTPSVLDEIFFKSVILITYYSKFESVGLILNKPSKLNLSDIIELEYLNHFPLYYGGPVERNTIQYFHTLHDIPESYKINNQLYWGGNFEFILKLIRENKINFNNIRFFIGYSGWGHNQLANELNQKDWIIQDLDSEKFMNTDINLWKDIMKKNKYSLWVNMPKNPNLN